MDSKAEGERVSWKGLQMQEEVRPCRGELAFTRKITSPPRRAAAKCQRAFTRAELLAVVAVLAVLAFVVLPALANSRPRSARVVCANNLRQIGMAFQLWGNDHNDTLPQEVHVSQGGTRAHPLAVNVWLHLAWVSNEVVSPNIYLCPSDTGKPARDFSGSPDGGYLNPDFRSSSTTYFLGYTAFSFPNIATAIIAGDRNISTEGVSGCARFGTALIVPSYSGTAYWTGGLHGTSGNILSYDGRVRQLDTTGLRNALAVALDENSAKHIIKPR
jgi:type II secretory pathway pseudopilin PulG